MKAFVVAGLANRLPEVWPKLKADGAVVVVLPNTGLLNRLPVFGKTMHLHNNESFSESLISYNFRYTFITFPSNLVDSFGQLISFCCCNYRQLNKSGLDCSQNYFNSITVTRLRYKGNFREWMRSNQKGILKFSPTTQTTYESVW